MQSVEESVVRPEGLSASESPGRNVELLLFLVCNGAAAGINVASRAALSWILPYSVAIVLAFLIALAVAFTLSRTIVFRAREGRVGRQMMWFGLVNLAALAQTLTVSLVFARVVFPAFDMAWHPEMSAHALGVVMPVVSSYFGHKHLSFKRR